MSHKKHSRSRKSRKNETRGDKRVPMTHCLPIFPVLHVLRISWTSVYIFLTTFFKSGTRVPSSQLFVAVSLCVSFTPRRQPCPSQCATRATRATPQKLDISGRKKGRKKRGFVTRGRVVPRCVQTSLCTGPKNLREQERS